MASMDTRREAVVLKVQQFSKAEKTTSASWGHIRYMTRKELLDEINALNSTAEDHVSSPSIRQSAHLRNANLRDVRKVDPTFSTRLEPAILVRAGCIILSLGRILCLITRESLYCVLVSGHEEVVRPIAASLAALLVAGEAESDGSAPSAAEMPNGGLQRSHSAGSLPTMVSRPPVLSPPPNARLDSRTVFPQTVAHLNAQLNGGSTQLLPNQNQLQPIRETPSGPTFEFCALEAVLMAASGELSRRQTSLSGTMQRALSALRRNVVGTQVVAGARQLDHVRELKQAVHELLVQSQAFEEALREVLEEDEDMAAMYLTRRSELGAVWGGGGGDAANPATADHEEVELLLESYLQEVGATVAELEVVTYAIEGTEKFVSFRLDSARNRLLKFDVIATASATALGVGQLISGIFGMNLPTSLNDADVAGADLAFVVVACSTVALVLMLVVLLLLVFYSPLLSWLACCRDDESGNMIDEALGRRTPAIIGQSTGANGMALNANGHGPNGGAPATEARRPPSRSVTPPVGIQYMDIMSASSAPASAEKVPARK